MLSLFVKHLEQLFEVLSNDPVFDKHDHFRHTSMCVYILSFMIQNFDQGRDFVIDQFWDVSLLFVNQQVRIEEFLEIGSAVFDSEGVLLGHVADVLQEQFKAVHAQFQRNRDEVLLNHH